MVQLVISSDFIFKCNRNDDENQFVIYPLVRQLA